MRPSATRFSANPGVPLVVCPDGSVLRNPSEGLSPVASLTSPIPTNGRVYDVAISSAAGPGWRPRLMRVRRLRSCRRLPRRSVSPAAQARDRELHLFSHRHIAFADRPALPQAQNSPDSSSRSISSPRLCWRHGTRSENSMAGVSKRAPWWLRAARLTASGHSNLEAVRGSRLWFGLADRAKMCVTSIRVWRGGQLAGQPGLSVRPRRNLECGTRAEPRQQSSSCRAERRAPNRASDGDGSSSDGTREAVGINAWRGRLSGEDEECPSRRLRSRADPNPVARRLRRRSCPSGLVRTEIAAIAACAPSAIRAWRRWRPSCRLFRGRGVGRFGQTCRRRVGEAPTGRRARVAQCNARPPVRPAVF